MSAWLRLTLVTMTIGGGFTGAVTTSQVLLSPQTTSPAFVAVGVVFLALHVFVLVSGLLFVQNSARVMPLVVALAIQIPYLSSPVVLYRFADGLCGGVGVAESGLFGWWRLGTDWYFGLLRPLPWGIGINLVPVAMLAALSISLAPGAIGGISATKQSHMP